jgi:hypothetical protein
MTFKNLIGSKMVPANRAPQDHSHSSASPTTAESVPDPTMSVPDPTMLELTLLRMK